jgi:two-component system, chemotaxis family, protein-glutamate methylesterase/glutaminase
MVLQSTPSGRTPHGYSGNVSGYAAFDVVLIAASQGGLAVGRRIIEALPAGYPAAVIYAQHRAPGPGRGLETLMRRWSALELRPAVDGAPLDPGTLTVAPAQGRLRIDGDRRLVLATGTPGLELADELFVSAAAAYGVRALAVVLSGRLRDGTRGVQAIKARGGRVNVQDPDTAEQPSMPWNARATGCADLTLTPAAIASALLAVASVGGAAELFSSAVVG